MKKFWIIALLLCIAVYCCGHFSLDGDKKKPEGTLERIDDLNASRYCVGLPLGGKAMMVGEEQFANARLCYFNSPGTAYDAILQRKADAFLFNSHSLDFISTRHPDLEVLPGVLDRVDIAIAFSPEQGDLRYEVNKYISRFKEDGTYNDMYQRWFKSDKLSEIPYIERPKSPTRTIRVGVCSQVPPMCFRSREEGELTGFDIELLRRIASALNARIELHDMDYTTLFEALDEGRIDMGLAGLNKDEKRPDQVIYSKNYIDSYIVAIVHTELVKPQNKGRK
jgi:ABC-type amino acid transport substrate-binding protein